MADIKMVETGDGGGFEIAGNDLVMIGGLQNMPYLAMFGGNPDQSTNGPKLPDQQAFDWWGNNLLYPNSPALQFNSLLEKKLTEVVLNSAGRIQIEQTVKRDLQFMQQFAIIEVSVSLTANDRVNIYIKIQQPNNQQSTELTYIWDATNNELTVEA